MDSNSWANRKTSSKTSCTLMLIRSNINWLLTRLKLLRFKALSEFSTHIFCFYSLFFLTWRHIVKRAGPGSWTQHMRACGWALDGDTLTRRVLLPPPAHAPPLPYFPRDDAAERRRGEYPSMPRCSSPGMDGRKDGRCLASVELAGARALAVLKKKTKKKPPKNRQRTSTRRAQSFRSCLNK